MKSETRWGRKTDERCHKHEQMAEKRVSERTTGRQIERRREGEREIWIRLKKASSSLWGMQ